MHGSRYEDLLRESRNMRAGADWGKLRGTAKRRPDTRGEPVSDLHEVSLAGESRNAEPLLNRGGGEIKNTSP